MVEWFRKDCAVCWVRKSARPLILPPLVLILPVIPLTVTAHRSKKHQALAQKHCLGEAVVGWRKLTNI